MHKNYIGPVLLAAAIAASPCSAATPAKNRPGQQAVVTAGFSFAVGPAPKWIVPVKEESAAALPRAPMHYPLIDDQTRIEAAGSTNYRHIVREVDDSAGLGPAGQIEIVFDPNYQTLTLHKIEIVRAGKRIDKLDRKKVQLLQRETQLEARMYDGRVTASIVLDDVRVGDRIEYSYSVSGDNPVFEGKAVGADWLAAEKGPVALAQLRLLAPENRSIATRAGAGISVTSTVQGGMRDTRFRQAAVPQLQFEPQAPATVMLDNEVRYSEFADWNEVQAWGSKLFAPSATTSATVQERANAIRAEAATPEQRLLRALTLVQKDIRYFGTEIGASSHRPAAPATVLERRAGDCKDKVALLVALLKALDIQAAPVLVSTTFREDVARLLPSPLAFDHAIARVELDGKVYWLDGTRNLQTGPLAQRQSTGLGKGLVLDPSSQGLADLPGELDEERVAVDEVIRIAKMTDDPVLESRITFSGETAERIRGVLSVMPAEKLESNFVDTYSRLYPGSHSLAPMRVEEQDGRNALTLVQRFAMPNFWRFPEQRMLVGEVGLWNMVQSVQVPAGPRKQPFRFEYPGIYRHAIAIELPEELSRAATKSASERDPHFDFRLVYENTPRSARVTSELRILRNEVAVADWDAYNAKLAKLRTHLSSTVTIPALKPDDSAKLRTQIIALATAMKKGERDATFVTPVQIDARMRLAVLTAELNGGLLNPRLRAEALVERAIQLDHLGRTGEAVADYEEAMRLVPDKGETIVAAAVNAFMRGDNARARELSQRALQLAPGDSEARNALGFADYFSADYRASVGDWKALLTDRSARDRAYPAIWLYLSTRRTGEDGVAAVTPFLPPQPSTEWPHQVLRWFAGAGSYDQALKVAKENPKDPSRLCELYFYAGEKSLLDGDVAAARDYFRKSVNTGVTEFNEYSMAQQELAKLGN